MKKKILAGTIVLVFFMALAAGCGGGGGGDGGEDPTTSTFTSGGNTLTAATTTSGSTKTTTVTDADGNTILTATITTAGVSFAFPGVEGTTDITLTSPLSSLPTNYSSGVLATYVAGQTLGEVAAICLNKDSPGCDWFPDTQCTLSCCADHDYCYQLNGCSASSWIPFVGSDACKNCNYIAAGCIELACAGLIPTEGDRCYDNRCAQFYDCGEADCYTCTSPCDTISPSSCTATAFTDCCGNGSCELGETRENCPGDCTEGSGYNTCCVENSDCPDETGEMCGATCCCCGLGEVCTKDGSHVCTGSAAMIVKLAPDLDIDAILKGCWGKPKSECL